MKKLPKAVFMIIQNFHPFIGGAEKQALQLAKAIVQKGQPVCILTRKKKMLPKREEIDGIIIYRLPSYGEGPIDSLIFLTACFFTLLWNSAQYHTIHVHLASSHSVAAALVGKLMDKRVIIKIGGGNNIGEIYLSQKSFLGRIKNFMLRILKPTLVIVTPTQMPNLKEACLDHLYIHHIPNGIDLDIFCSPTVDDQATKRRGLKWEGKVGLYIGRFSRDKLPLDIFKNVLKGFKDAKEVNPSLQLKFVGTGPLKLNYQSLIKEMGLVSSVSVLDSQEDVLSLYWAADFFILPSVNEGLSNALLEALATGLPVMGSRVPGIEAIIKEGVHGFLFNPFNSTEIRDCFLKSIPGSMKQANISLSKNYNLKMIADRYLSLYSKNVMVDS